MKMTRVAYIRFLEMERKRKELQEDESFITNLLLFVNDEGLGEFNFEGETFKISIEIKE